MSGCKPESPWELRQGRYQDVLADVECDALITDTPYSERTHGAYREMRELRRRQINYAAWSPEDVRAFVASWAPRTRGWFVSITDHSLVSHWCEALEATGRYVFSPLSCMEPGSRVRLTGDGPTQWSVYAVVARPATRDFARWGALPGGYIVPYMEARVNAANRGEANTVMGKKPLWLMRALVRDYSRPGDLICDPCAGGGTTLLAAVMEGRRAIGAECMPEHYEIARKRLAKGFTPSLFSESAGSVRAVQADLFGGEGEP